MIPVPDLEKDERFCGQALVAGLTADGREVVVTPRMFNSIVTIGPAGAPWIEDQW
jgi:hypothetical protein